MRSSRSLALAALTAFAAPLTTSCAGPVARAAAYPLTKKAELPADVLVAPASGAALHVVVRVPDDIDLAASAAWQLIEEGGTGSSVPAEVIFLGKDAEPTPPKQPRLRRPDASGPATGTRLLVATIPPGKSGKPRRFLLRPDGDGKGEGFVFRSVSDRSLGLHEGEAPVLVYNHGMISREGVPERYNRANYFHPVYGLDGEVLTDDFPKDHYHQRGIFWAWRSVRAGEGKKNTFASWIPEGLEYRFERWTSRHAGAGAAALGAETGWHAGGRKIVHERMLVVVHRALGDWRAVDFELTWTATEGPVTLKGAAGKGYGGFTFRSAPRKDTVITVPDGRTEKDLVAKRLPWADISGTFEGPPGTQSDPGRAGRKRPGRGPVTSGAAVFVAPDHPGFPPTWLTRHYGTLCVGWPGLEEATLEPGRPVTCRYRMWFHRGIPDCEAVQAAYDAYRKGLEAHWEGRKP